MIGSSCAYVSGDPPKYSEGREWIDDFDGIDIDTDLWGFELGRVRNKEDQVYTANNHSVVKGLLAISARSTPSSDSNGSVISSSSLTTRGKFSFETGSIEARILFPNIKGVWGAFWLLGEDIGKVGWPASGEIDVVEYLGHTPNVAFHNVHSTIIRNGILGAGAIQTPLKPNNSGFHTYRATIDEEMIRIYVDGDLRLSTRRDVTGLNHKRFFVILNLAIGGTWGGRSGVDVDSLPVVMMIDYVKYSPIPLR